MDLPLTSRNSGGVLINLTNGGTENLIRLTFTHFTELRMPSAHGKQVQTDAIRQLSKTPMHKLTWVKLL